MVHNLVDRAINLSIQKYDSNNLEKITSYLLDNNYPANFIKKIY